MRMSTSLMSLFLFSILCCPTVVSAKNRLLNSDPSDGAHLTKAPQGITLTFDKKTKLTVLDLQLPDGNVMKLALPATQLMKKQYVVSFPKLVKGSYLFRWTGRGKDHWYFSGAVQFEVDEAPVE